MRKKLNSYLVVGLVLMFILLIMILIPGVLAPGDPYEYKFFRIDPDTGAYQSPPYPPDATYRLGSDVSGRDLYARLIWGARFTVGMALIVAGLRFLIALILGLIGGYRGGILAWLLRQFATILSGLPIILLAFVLLSTMERAAPDHVAKPYVFLAILVLLGWPRLAEQIRLQVRDTATRAFIESARAVGASNLRIVFRHILPTMSGQLLALFAVEVSFALIVMGQLGVLGIFPGGAFMVEVEIGEFQKFERLPEWGQMLGVARHSLGRYPWIPIVPGTAFAVTVMAFNLLAEGLRRQQQS